MSIPIARGQVFPGHHDDPVRHLCRVVSILEFFPACTGNQARRAKKLKPVLRNFIIA
jgi:hypothetical protein